MVTSAAEAELGAAFQNTQKAAQFRNTLAELGYPTPHPYLGGQYRRRRISHGHHQYQCETLKKHGCPYFWLRDRIKELQFFIRHIKGRWNISDFFTKPLPKDKFEQFSPYIVTEIDPNIEDTRPKRNTITMGKTS
jgi:hypothetical protein